MEVQSAAALCPAVVPALLSALDRPHRQRLSAALLSLQQQQQHHHQTEADVLATAAQDMRQLGVWDVLLLLSLQSQLQAQQWDADVSLLLLQGVQDAHRYV